MADIEVSYKNAVIKQQTGSGTVTLHTEGKYCEDDIDIVYTAPGGPTEPEPLDVDFIDYDGTLLYTYTAADFANLDSLPANPSHTGLTAQGWNWTLADAKAYVAEYGTLVIGQNYTTSDGKTRFYVSIPAECLWQPAKVLFYTTVKGGVTIDWGDGNSQVSTANANASGTYSHTYATGGDYVITLTVTSGTVALGYNGSGATAFGYTNGNDGNFMCFVKKIEIGNNVTTLYRQCFNCAQIESISIPTTVTSFGSTGSHFSRTLVKAIVIPSGITTVYQNFAANTPFLKYLSMPKSVSTIHKQQNLAFALRKFTTGYISTIDGTGSLAMTNYCYELTHFALAGTYATVVSYCCYCNNVVRQTVIPASVTKINDYAFTNDCLEVHMRPTSVPTLDNTRALSQVRKIYVPYSADHSILAAYQAATNWSTFASKMEEESA